jgi:hypothetical protein
MENADEAWERWRRITQGDAADPLEVLRLVAMFERYFDAVETQAVRAARAAGRSWQEISKALGVRKQSAWERHRHVERIQSSREWIEVVSGAKPRD